MKTVLLLIASVIVLSGCAIVPYGHSGVYAGPAVVVPYGGYYGHRGGYGHHRRGYY